ncbi:WDR1-like protein [Mya arenaria]|uniref:WDR1-like protein n=1 Tax=Mya arenaria TaxID=6604 RepID=A0ABY7FHB9_MYAAR|nr:WDR1-like protein [Mya arenaria]
MSKPELRCVFASMPKTERGKFIVLGADRKGQNFLYANGTNIYIRDINVRIWDTVNPEHVLKKEFHVQGGPIKDISWSEDNTKIAVAGEGRERCCKVITSDSGNTVGEIGGHTGTVNAIAFRPVRPFRIVSAGEDMRSQLYKGPPFKYEKDCKDHTNFVNCVRYSPTGDVYITGGADGQVAFSPDGKEVLTVSGDKTAKIWNVESREEVTKFELGKELGDMLVSCVWSGDNIIVVLLKGYINYLDRNNPSTPIKTLRGHNKLITAMTPSTDRSKVFTTSLEAVSAKSNAVVVVNKGNVMFQQEVKFGPTCADISPDKTTVAFGGKGEHNHFTKQTAKIFSLDWAPNSQYFATGSLDGSFVVWCLSTVFGKEQVCSRMDAHKKCSVSSLAWLSDNTIITASNDCTIKQWDIKFA